MDIKNEVWKDCKGYEGLYQISSLGRVWNVKTQRYLKGVIRGKYLGVHLTAKNGKRKYEFIHRLVALAFLPNPNNLPQVNHKDENKENNCLDNLEWCSANYNNNYGTRTERAVKNNPQCKKVKCIETGKVYNTMNQASRDTGIPQANISKVCNGERHTAGGYHWCFWNKEGDVIA